MSRFCLDTSAYSFFQRGDSRVLNLLDSADWVGIPVATLGELETGFLRGRRQTENQRFLQTFLDHPVVETVDIDPVVARSYARISVALRRAGTPIPTNDIWIGATAEVTRSEVLTFDQHFHRIPQIRSLVLEPIP